MQPPGRPDRRAPIEMNTVHTTTMLALAADSGGSAGTDNPYRDGIVVGRTDISRTWTPTSMLAA